MSETKKTITTIELRDTKLIVFRKSLKQVDEFKSKMTVDQIQEFELTKVREEKLYAIRRSGKPVFILKRYGEYFFTEIPKDLKLIARTNLGVHLCGADCSSMSAGLSFEGGCPKVRDRSYDSYKSDGYTIREAYDASKRIEKYSRVRVGFETVNTVYDALYVIECSSYKKFIPKKKETTSYFEKKSFSTCEQEKESFETRSNERMFIC